MKMRVDVGRDQLGRCVAAGGASPETHRCDPAPPLTRGPAGIDQQPVTDRHFEVGCSAGDGDLGIDQIIAASPQRAHDGRP